MRPQRLLESNLSYQREQVFYRDAQERKRRSAAYAARQREKAAKKEKAAVVTVVWEITVLSNDKRKTVAEQKTGGRTGRRRFV